MGSLWHWEISPEFVERFPIFIETGYGTGNGLEYAVRHAFKKIYSIEIWPAAVDHGVAKFSSDPRVDIIKNDSAVGILSILLHYDGPVVFWLDAHFPGADCFGQPFDAAKFITRLPLPRELHEIRRSLPGGDYTILIDDLHCWADLPWEMGRPPDYIEMALPKELSLDFLKPFCATHDVQIFLNYKGSALISPRGAPQLRFIG